ncbi:MAG: hydroxyacid dehydrogenase [Pseudomonadota bacterium]
MADIVITEFMDEAAIRAHLSGFDVRYDPTLVDSPDALRAALAGARGLIVRNRTQVRGPLLDQAPALAVVGRLGVGLDNIDVEACRSRRIDVFPATGANDLSVAEYVVTAALLLLRGAWFASAAVVAGQWPRQRLMGREAHGKRLGLVGFGAIARETASRARALGMTIAAHDPFLPAAHPAWAGVDNLTLANLLATSDGVSLHVPLTPQTTRLVDADALARLKPDAILVNAARGGIVDEAALVDALRSGRLGGAALDVFECEPVDPAGGKAFAGIPNLLLTPHIAGVTVESNVRVSDVTARAVAARLAG